MRMLQLPDSERRPLARAQALVFEDPRSRALLSRIEQIAPTDATVLIVGETGTGKEIVARHVHHLSARSGGPFVAVNCGALSPSLFESELFGHERGAFSGALRQNQGWFEVAHGGTLFLDEIGDLPLAAQVKLLRVLQEREVVRVGARRPIRIDIRVIAATNANLEQAVADNRFREDLFYRLRVAPITLEPLRERPGDILPLAQHFAGKYAARLSLPRSEITPDAIARLRAHAWPGNIRELENAIHHALLVSADGVIRGEALHLAGTLPAAAPQTSLLRTAVLSLLEQDHPRLHEHIELEVFRTIYEFCEKNQVRTARVLGLSRNIVRARLIQYGLLTSTVRGASDASAQDTTPPTTRSGSAPKTGIRAVHRADRSEALRVVHHKFGLLALVKALGALDTAMSASGSRVEWIACATGMEAIDALSSGRADVGMVGEAPPVFAHAADAPVVYLAAEPPRPESEAIVVHHDAAIHSVADLRGKTVALARGANVLYFVLRALEEANLGLDEVDLVYLSPQAARAAFESRQVDAWAIWNPLLLSMQVEQRARVLRDARGLAPNRAFYVGRRAITEARPDLIEAFLDQVGAAGRWVNESPERAARALAPHADIGISALEAGLARMQFRLRPMDGEIIASQQHIADTLYRFKLISAPVDESRAVWSPSSAARHSA